MGFNTITVVGKLTKDPEYKSLENNNEMASFTVHYAEKKDDGFINYHFRVAVFGTQCNIAMKYLKKGFVVGISGTLKLNEYVDREGKNRVSLEIRNAQISLMDNREINDQAETSIPKESGVKVLDNGQPVNSNGAGQQKPSTRPASQNGNGRSNAQYPSRRY